MPSTAPSNAQTGHTVHRPRASLERGVIHADDLEGLEAAVRKPGVHLRIPLPALVCGPYEHVALQPA